MRIWGIPILGPNEGRFSLDDAFLGDVTIRLKGHEKAYEGRGENWYSIHALVLYTRYIHCGTYIVVRTVAVGTYHIHVCM